MKRIFNNLFNLWRPVKSDLPPVGMQVLCYWNEYGDDIFITCKRVENNERTIFEGWDEWVSHPEVTHWKYLSKKPI